ncbi:MAG: FlgD immunoglobulin-like domain containing protein [Candidatus Krumholzibacteria bacterium]
MKNTARIHPILRLAAWAVVAVLCVAGTVLAQNVNLPGRSVIGKRPQAGDPEYLTIGPGKVRLSFTRGGGLLELTPTWTTGRSLIGGGGLIAFAAGPDGELIELVNTSLSDLAVKEETRDLPTGYEGMAGGFRAPSLDPDDDHDGRANEDRLDGVDNDNDGKIDEDFAAIGDEMVVTEFASGASGASLFFHQECYAWSLPNIDGAVMVSLQVRNDGTEPLYDLRLGALLQVRGPFVFSELTIAPVGSRSSVACWVSTTEGAGSIALVAMPERGRDTGWLGGYAPVAKDFSMAVQARANGGTKETVGRRGSGAGRVGRRGIQIDGDANVYALSPARDVLLVGETVRIDFALVVVPRGSNVDEAATNAFKTYTGDGTHTYLPPPVSMTPRVLWGYYRPVTGVESGLSIELEELGDKPVDPDDISYFSGVDESQVERDVAPTGERRIVIRGQAIERILQRRERVTLKGRLRSGEFFEAILRPRASMADPRSPSEIEAQRFWKSDGKLSRELLNGSPNPFRGVTTIFYEVPSVVETADGRRIESAGAFETNVKVYNVTGRLVAVLVDRQEFPGVHSVNWNAVDDSGNPVASGVYYIKLQIEQRYITRRLTLLK